MKLESQVISLEIAKKLKELGVKQESLFSWYKFELWSEPRIWMNPDDPKAELACLSGKREFMISAFTVAELLTMMPRYVKNTWEFSLNMFMGKYEVRYEETDSAIDWLNESDENPANALSLMLIYLLENKLITL